MDLPEAAGRYAMEQQMHHVYHIAFLLRQKLVPDLISTVMDYAGIYWSTFKETDFLQSAMVSQQNAPREILASDSVVSRTRAQHPVRKVVFRITSHDQGWASHQNQGAWTWFTARKVLPEGSLQPNVLHDSSAKQSVLHGREVCRNKTADRQWHTHEIEWRADSDDSDEAEWVSSLRVNDRVVIDAWAMFPSWTNHIQHASIALHTIAIV